MKLEEKDTTNNELKGKPMIKMKKKKEWYY